MLYVIVGTSKAAHLPFIIMPGAMPRDNAGSYSDEDKEK